MVAYAVAGVLSLFLIFILIFHHVKTTALKNELNAAHVKLTGLQGDLAAASDRIGTQCSELACMQENLDSSRNIYEQLFDKMLNGFFIFEPVYNNWHRLKDLRFIKVNPAFYQQLGKSEEKVIGNTWMEVFGYQNLELGYYQNLLNTGRAERFEAVYSKTGTYYLVDAFLISDNQVGVIFENITEYKRAIKEVRMLNAELEKRVRGRTAELEEAVRELEAFSYTVSHDLKSPLRAVGGYAKFLMEDLEAKLDEDAVQMLNNIRTISTESIEMISRLMLYSKTSRAELHKEEIDMEKKFNDVYNELRLGNPNRNINMIIETALPAIYADRVLIREVIQNVLANAVKFTRDRGIAEIRVGCSITTEEYIFYVKDNGAGFDMKYADKLFGVFQRLHTVGEFEGSGIGLVTVKKIMEKHGGRVWIEGKKDAGVTLYFAVPNERV